jgi:hypothetical protein
LSKGGVFELAKGFDWLSLVDWGVSLSLSKG